MISISNIDIDGPDAFEFLQGQLSNDLARLDTETQILAAWCNPKGRVIWFGSVSSTSSGFTLSSVADMAESIVERLTVFRFRAKVEFSIRNDVERVDPSDFVASGQALIGAAQTEGFTPHMLNLDLLDAVSFDKGCYTGQEIVARTHYKGATKRRTLRFRSSASLQVGDKLECDGRSIGEILNVAGSEFLAVVPVDSADKIITVHDSAVERLPLPYL